jgi:glycine/D-amino acid oxidase-like deaminating enzyme
LTIGGTRNYGSYDLKPDKHDSQSIWERATALVPSLKHAEIIKEWVGLRPTRTPVRLEKELIKDGPKSVKVYI